MSGRVEQRCGARAPHRRVLGGSISSCGAERPGAASGLKYRSNGTARGLGPKGRHGGLRIGVDPAIATVVGLLPSPCLPRNDSGRKERAAPATRVAARLAARPRTRSLRSGQALPHGKCWAGAGSAARYRSREYREWQETSSCPTDRAMGLLPQRWVSETASSGPSLCPPGPGRRASARSWG